MRKKISCKIIRSVPLTKSDDTPWNTGKSRTDSSADCTRESPLHTRIRSAWAKTAFCPPYHSEVVTKANLDDIPAARTLDLYA